MCNNPWHMLSLRMKHLSIRHRLLVAASVWIGGLILIAGLVIPKLVDDYLTQEATSQLYLAMDEIAGNLTLDANGKLILSEPLSDPRFKQPYSGLYWNVTGERHQLRSRSLWDKNITREEQGDDSDLFGANEERLIYISQTLSIPEVSEPLQVIVGIDENPLEVALESLIGQLGIILLVLFFGVLAFLILLINWSLRPLSHLQTELQALKSGQSQIIEGDYPSEVSPLITDLNALVFHYQELLQRARNHAGNLSHSIKTPLAVLNNQVAELSEVDRKGLIHSIQQVQLQIDYHMSRARMAGSMNILSVKSNPCKRVDAIALAFDKVYSDRQLTFVNELEDALALRVEQTDLDEMLGNLIENAYKWATSLIRVHASMADNQVHIMVEDDGHGIAQAQLDNITKRGFRLDESTPGTGLGLNIVSELAYSYRGSLSFEKSALGGVKATLSFKDD